METKTSNYSWSESCSLSAYFPTSSGSGSTVADSKSFTRLSRSNWRDGIKRHYPVGNAYGFTKITREPTTISGIATVSRPSPNYKLVPFTVSGTTGYSFGTVAYDTSSLIAAAKTDALGKFMSKANGDTAGLVMAGELKDSLKLFHPRCSSMVKLTTTYYRSFRKIFTNSRFRSAFLRDLNNLYLEWTYGIAPFMSDMESANSAIQHIINNDMYRRDSGKGYSSDSAYTTTSVQTTGAGHFTFRFRTKVDINVEVSIKGGRHVYADWTSDALAQNFGFNLHSVPSAAWELTPYSFVVDYFSNVGSLISAITGTNQHHYFVTTSTKTSKKSSPVNLFGHCSYVGSRGQDISFLIQGSTEYAEFTRALSLPSASELTLRFNLPTFKQDINLASLIYAFKNRR